MNHQQQNNNSQVNEPVTTQEAIDLLLVKDGSMRLFVSKMKPIALLVLV